MAIKMKYFILLAFLLASITSHGKDRTRKDAVKIFQISFFDTAYTREIPFALHFDDSMPKPYLLVLQKDTTAVISDSIVINLDEPLNIKTIENELNENIFKKYKTTKTISQTSIYDIFIWMYTKTHVDTARPIAGTLTMSTYVKYFTNNDDDYMSCESRLHTTDSLIDKLKFYTYSVEELNTQINSAKKALQNNDSLKKVYDGLQKDFTTSDINMRNRNYKSTYSDYVKKTISDVKQINDSTTRSLTEIQSLLYKFQDNVEYISDQKKINKNTKTDLTQTNQIYIDLKNRNVITETDVDLKTLDKLQGLIDGKQYSSAIKLLGSSSSLVTQKISSIKGTLQKYKDDKTRLLEEVKDKKNKSDSTLKALENKIDSSKKMIIAWDEGVKKSNISRIKSIDLQFEKGFLENAKVLLEIDGGEMIFENNYAIGFTSKNNYRQLSYVTLFARINNSPTHIWLSDVIRNYNNELDLYTRDYSPADTILHIDPSENSRVILRKAAFVNLFETKYFTDFDGLANKQPNGLVQFEISRKFNITTHRRQIRNDANYGFGSYINIYGTLNKIENSYKYLPLHNNDVVVNNTLVSPSYATNMEFLQYRNFTLGMEGNMFLFDVPSAKSTFTFDMGIQYGHTPVLDSSRTVTPGNVLTAKPDSLKYNANLVTFYPKFTVQIFSERRVGFSCAYQPQYTCLFSNNQYKQIESYAKSNSSLLPIEPNAHWSHMFEFFLTLELNQTASSKLFFRGRFYLQQGDANTYFPQVQLGYSYNINFTKLAK